MSAATAETQAEEESRDVQAAQSSVSSDGRHLTLRYYFSSEVRRCCEHERPGCGSRKAGRKGVLYSSFSLQYLYIF